jgi:hypothetical protein
LAAKSIGQVAAVVFGGIMTLITVVVIRIANPVLLGLD